MSSKRKSSNTNIKTDSESVDDLITTQYRYIKELAALKYESEKRENKTSFNNQVKSFLL